MIKHDDAKLKTIMGFFSGFNISGCALTEFVRAVNGFIGHQWTLHKAKLDGHAVVNFIEVLMVRFARNDLSPIDWHLLKSSGTENFFGYAAIAKVNITKIDVVTDFIAALKKKDVSDIVDLSKSFLMNVFSVSSPEIKRRIKLFVLKVDVSGLNRNSRLAFDLTLIAYKLKSIDLFSVEELEDAMKVYGDGVNFSSELYGFSSLLRYILKSEESPRLKAVLNVIDSSIASYKKRPVRSIL